MQSSESTMQRVMLIFMNHLVEYMKNPQITKDRLYIETMEYVMSKNKTKLLKIKILKIWFRY